MSLVKFLIFSILFINICSQLGSANNKNEAVEEEPKRQNMTEEQIMKQVEESLQGVEEDKSMEKQIKDAVNYYLKITTFKNPDFLDNDEFEKMFVYVCRRGAMKLDDTAILRKLAQKLLKDIGTPVYIKNIDKYFDIMTMTFTYTKLIEGKIEDL